MPPKQETGIAVAVDMGEIHLIVSHDGENTIIYNGRIPSVYHPVPKQSQCSFPIQNG